MVFKNADSSWKPYADLMAALMIIFMFIAISYILEIQKEKEDIKMVVEEYQNTKNELFTSLQEEFKSDFRKWEVELGDDLSIKFTNPDILFARGESKLTPKFKQILSDFLPRYFDIILSEKYKENVLEVRIEGHTDKVPATQYDPDPYIGNVILSQLRSTNVLKYLKKSDYYKSQSNEVKKYLRFVLTANGLSYGRMLDNNKNLVSKTGKQPVADISRRVEFKILTKTERAVENVINKLKEQRDD